MNSIAIIGGGASGLFCAITIKRNNAAIPVTIFEKQPRILRKLLATGNGQCNFTNTGADIDKDGISHYYGRDVAFVQSALKGFSPNDAISFFDELGIVTFIENNGRCYPNSLQSSSIADALRLEAEKLGVLFIVGDEVAEIQKTKKGFLIKNINGTSIANTVVIACGGAASPDLGGTYSGYNLLQSLVSKCRLIEISAVLVQVKTEKSIIFGLQGVKINAAVSFYCGDKLLSSSLGDLLFTGYGLSGNTIFTLSANCHLYGNLTASIDFLPDYTKEIVTEMLFERRKKLSHLTAEFFLSGFIHKKVGMALLKLSGIDKLSLLIEKIPDDTLYILTKALKGFKVKITGTTGLRNAQVTAGGISTNAFNTDTMECLHESRIYAVGEVLDIHGDCGGYNLHWAWASAYAAGTAISKQCK